MKKPWHPFFVNGEPHLYASRAAQIIGLTPTTLAGWLKRGVTSYGLELTVRHDGKRRLIPERQAVIMAELNKTYPLPRHGFLPADELDDLKRAARYYSKLQLIAAQP
jgi:hypothetical protein